MTTNVIAASAIGWEPIRIAPWPGSSRARSIIGLQAPNEGGRFGTQRRRLTRKPHKLAERPLHAGAKSRFEQGIRQKGGWQVQKRAGKCDPQWIKPASQTGRPLLTTNRSA